MKRIVSLLTVISLLAVMLTGCGKTNVDNSVSALKAKGFTDYITYETDEELFDATERINLEIEYMGGDFTVELKGYTSLMQDWNHLSSIEFITFSRKREAKAYAELYVAKRDALNSFKVAQSGKVVVLTNSDAAVKILGFDFK